MAFLASGTERENDDPGKHGIQDSGPLSSRLDVAELPQAQFVGRTFKTPDEEDRIEMEALGKQQQQFEAGMGQNPEFNSITSAETSTIQRN